MKRVPVKDAGTLYDADTPEDYSRLLNYHNSQLIRPEASVNLSRETPFFDKRMAMLLMLTDETRSVREACQRMQVSYSTGWKLIHNLEQQLGCTLVLRSQGGANGGRSTLTDEASRLLDRYRRYQGAIQSFAEEQFDAYFADLFKCGKFI